ncbi:hypothetical protein HDV57DRAFT_312252 [Trichoderma longibrachiatum]|uniref:Uncharacterized protein n=1 Tax=Trichoderma longibrachiatum ATCC 18648 TaxID=983965 RepID=A0A2T4CBP8_TRILO|nr:hypothetical protein M440DRAFT_1157408 [Trichoderma longibrachiatum ATCC 18648]
MQPSPVDVCLKLPDIGMQDRIRTVVTCLAQPSSDIDKSHMPGMGPDTKRILLSIASYQRSHWASYDSMDHADGFAGCVRESPSASHVRRTKDSAFGHYPAAFHSPVSESVTVNTSHSTPCRVPACWIPNCSRKARVVSAYPGVRVFDVIISQSWNHVKFRGRTRKDFLQSACQWVATK